MCLAPNPFLRHRESVLETGHISSVERKEMSSVGPDPLPELQQYKLLEDDTEISALPTEEISSVETRQMRFVERGQMSSVET